MRNETSQRSSYIHGTMRHNAPITFMERYITTLQLLHGTNVITLQLHSWNDTSQRSNYIHGSIYYKKTVLCGEAFTPYALLPFFLSLSCTLRDDVKLFSNHLCTLGNYPVAFLNQHPQCSSNVSVHLFLKMRILFRGRIIYSGTI